VAHEVQVLLKVLALKAWTVAPIVVVRQILEPPKAAREKAAAERTVRDEADPELAQRWKNLVLGIAPSIRLRLGAQRRTQMAQITQISQMEER